MVPQKSSALQRCHGVVGGASGKIDLVAAPKSMWCPTTAGFIDGTNKLLLPGGDETQGITDGEGEMMAEMMGE